MLKRSFDESDDDIAPKVVMNFFDQFVSRTIEGSYYPDQVVIVVIEPEKYSNINGYSYDDLVVGIVMEIALPTWLNGLKSSE